MSDGLFLKTFNEVSKLYPSIEADDMIIDNTCMQMVSNPHQFDMIVTGNLYVVRIRKFPYSTFKIIKII